jgi:hypothetical protein
MSSILRFIVGLSAFVQLFFFWRIYARSSPLFRLVTFLARVLGDKRQGAGDAHQAGQPAMPPKLVFAFGLVVVLFLIGLLRMSFQ